MTDDELQELYDKMDAIYEDSEPQHFDRAGNPIKPSEWLKLMHTPDYKVLRQTPVGRFVISTVWLGLNHSLGLPPMIFETMVFDVESEDTDRFLEEQYRYSTEVEAMSHHEKIVKQFRLLVEGVGEHEDTSG